ncbi:enoyl-CoA hydratase/isomerase family protein [Natronomonas sp. F2-12]|jgi:enoyl-CoA hydratase/carnithine racemase|uniref:Enoyl-CoA hydratase/isomerase family protein n=1 Tax=Natronomonas aquatica TaxID=2841590 RepID=A0A9R1D4T0_9EURY|nr:enoyl-CoA hydratase-related protein [Natronomonas aquatica]MCQ4333674.1 enoyl-CoA hydratase/isomerase family protein [Natronomonas aquatica]
MSDPVRLDIENGVATVTLNSPENRNALNPTMSGAIADAVAEAEAADDVRCLVVTGTEGTFCAGGDVEGMAERLEGSTPLHETVEEIRLETSRAIERVAAFHLPTIAKVDGVAYGAGANLAIATDITLASADAKISFGFRQVGLAVDTGTSYLLPRQVGTSRAKELVLTGELLDAEAAEDLGLFNEVFEENFEERAAEFVEPIANGPTVALRTSKQLIDQGFDTTLPDAIANEAAAQASVLASRDHEEGARAFKEGRAPEFEGR